MGRTACTEPQCLYNAALYLYLYLYSHYGPYGQYTASVPVQQCTLPFLVINCFAHTSLRYLFTLPSIYVYVFQLISFLHVSLWKCTTHFSSPHRNKAQFAYHHKWDFSIQSINRITDALFQISAAKQLKTALVCVIIQRTEAISYGRYRSHPQGSKMIFFGFLSPEYGTKKFHRNVGKKLQLLAA